MARRAGRGKAGVEPCHPDTAHWGGQAAFTFLGMWDVGVMSLERSLANRSLKKCLFSDFDSTIGPFRDTGQ